MKTTFSENIKALRKQKGFTQEQLAEAMGVTAGAIYKWEQNLSTPDIGLIMELASFFGVSVDSLVGYQMCPNDKERILKAIKGIKLEKNYEGCWDDVESWLQRYPNDFDIVYHSGVLYNLAGIEARNDHYFSRSVELMQHACDLIDQNKDPEISETSIGREIGISYLSLGKTYEGLEQLKSHNPCGIHNDIIGQELATIPGRRMEAWPYLSDALIQCTIRLYRIVIGFINLFFEKQDYRSAIEMLNWMIAYLNGLRSDKGASYLDKDVTFLLALCGAVYQRVGDPESAKECLRKARRTALAFDAAPNYTNQNIRFCEEYEPRAAYDNIGSTAMETIVNILQEGIDGPDDPVLKLWEEVCHEE